MKLSGQHHAPATLSHYQFDRRLGVPQVILDMAVKGNVLSLATPNQSLY